MWGLEYSIFKRFREQLQNSLKWPIANDLAMGPHEQHLDWRPHNFCKWKCAFKNKIPSGRFVAESVSYLPFGSDRNSGWNGIMSRCGHIVSIIVVCGRVSRHETGRISKGSRLSGVRGWVAVRISGIWESGVVWGGSIREGDVSSLAGNGQRQQDYSSGELR